MSSARDPGARARLAYAAFYLLVLYAPVAFFPLFSFNDSVYVAFPLRGFTTAWYQALLENESLHDALWSSLMVGAAAAVASTALGTLAGMAVVRHRFPGRTVMVGLLMAPLIVPTVIVSVSLLALLNALGLGASLTSVIVGHTVICLPFAYGVMVSRFEGLDGSYQDAANDLGDPPWKAFLRVTVPLVLPGLVASLLLTFTVSFDEFILAFFLSSNQPTLPVFIWSQMRFPDRLPLVLALGSVLILVSVTLVIASMRLRGKDFHS